MKFSKLDKGYLIVSIIFFLVLWTLKIVEDLNLIPYHSWPVRIGVPLYVGITFIYNLIAPGIEKTKFIAFALLFANLAEIINAANLDFGLLFFVVTHILLTIFHTKKTIELKALKVKQNDVDWLVKYHKIQRYSGFLMLVLFIFISTFIVLNLHEKILLYELVVPIYMFFLSIMAWRAICTYGEEQSGRIIIGSLLFYICDVFILLELTAPNFDNPPLYMLVISWITYLPALFLLSVIGKSIFMNKTYPNF